MEGLIIQNPNLIAFENNNDPEILKTQFSYSQKSRIDLIIKNDENIGIVELKKGIIEKKGFNQILNYIKDIPDIHKELIENEIIDDSIKTTNYFGLLVGTGIEEETLFEILNHNKTNDTKVYVIILQQHRTINDQLFLTSNNINRPKISPGTNLDFTKYRFEGNEYGKGRLVLAVIKKYISDNPNITINDLNQTFPSSIQGTYDIAKKSLDVEESDKLKKRYFVSNPIELRNEDIVITNQWGIGNISGFIEAAMSKGYIIEKV